jgi:hypothetical protein
MLIFDSMKKNRENIAMVDLALKGVHDITYSLLL